MESRIWNYPFPKRFLLGGKQTSIQEPGQQSHSWALCRSPIDPLTLTVEPLQKTRGEEFKFFPRFRDQSPSWDILPESGQSPTVENFSWDWIEFNYKPLEQVGIRSIIWCPESRVICGESWISNQSAKNRVVCLDLVCSPQSFRGGNQITLGKVKGRQMLTGWIGSQNLILFMSRNPYFREDPYPFLENELSLSPHQIENVHWICILSNSAEQGIELLDQTLQLDWAGEIARRKVSLQGQVEITTGTQDWDFVLSLSQKRAQSIYQQITSQNNQNNPNNTVLSPIQALMMLQSLIMLTPEMAKNILDLVFNTNPESEIGGDISDQGPTPPILTGELLWQFHQSGFSGDIWSGYLDQASRWLNDWFTPRLDKDGDGIPELVNHRILQTPGMDVSAEPQSAYRPFPYPYLESPGLGALLFNDLSKVKDLTQLDRRDSDPLIRERIENLRTYLKDSWMPEANKFQSRDSRSHLVVDGFTIRKVMQPGLNILTADFPQSARIGIILHGENGEHTPKDIRVICHGMDWQGNYRIEELNSGDFIQGERFDWAISESVYSKIDYCILIGFNVSRRISLVAPPTSLNDITQTLPLWAGILADNQTRDMYEQVLLDPERYWTPYGFSRIPGPDEMIISLFWNLLLGQSMHRLGMRKSTAGLIQRLMDVSIPSQKSSGAVYPAYSAQTGKGMGAGECIESFFPVRFFLQVLGIEIIEGGRVLISGENPFPWPVSIRYRDLMIRKEDDRTVISKLGEEDRILIEPDNFQLDLT